MDDDDRRRRALWMMTTDDDERSRSPARTEDEGLGARRKYID